MLNWIGSAFPLWAPSITGAANVTAQCRSIHYRLTIPYDLESWSAFDVIISARAESSYCTTMFVVSNTYGENPSVIRVVLCVNIL